MKKSDLKKMYDLEDAHFWFVGKRFCIQKVLNGFTKKWGRILDVGCGTGGTTIFLKQFGDVQGVEYDNYALSLATKRLLTVTKGEAENLPFRDNYFDAVFLLDVLYHKKIISVEKALSEAYRVLTPSGSLIITDSAMPILYGRHDIALQGKRRFSTHEIRVLLDKIGFTTKRSSYFFFFLFPILYIKRNILKALSNSHTSDLTPIHPLINNIFIFIISVESWLLQYYSFPFGSSLIVLASKKGR